jgi:MYXO-CTERM domain-containing protein
VLGKCGGYMSDVAEAVLWSAGVHPTISNPMPARVLNLSLGSQIGCSVTMQSAVDAARAAGVVVVAAAGNASADAAASSVAGCDGVIAVAASTRAGDLAAYSNRSATHVALSAPGGDARSIGGQVLSTMNLGTTAHDAFGWTHAERSGTSFAAPHVAAAAALLLSRHPEMAPGAVRAALTAPGAVTEFATTTTCAASRACGSGILNAGRALAMTDLRLLASLATIDFGNLVLGAEAVRRVEVTNPGPSSVRVGAAQVVASQAGRFAVVQDGCADRFLAPLARCAIDVGVTAGSAPLLATASLALWPAAGELPLLALPIRAAIGSLLQASPDRRSLPSLAAGDTTSVELTFANASDASRRLQPLRVGGTGAATVTQDGCSNVALAPRESCAVALSLGPRTGTRGEYQVQVSANTDGRDDVAYTVTFAGVATGLAGPVTGRTASAPLDTAVPGGSGGGCTVLAGDGPADATFALLALAMAGWRRQRKKRP